VEKACPTESHCEKEPPQRRDEHLYFARRRTRSTLSGPARCGARLRSAWKPRWSTGGNSRRRVHCIDSAWRSSQNGFGCSYSRVHTLLIRQPRHASYNRNRKRGCRGN
jgi:hypothetical protein